MYKYKRKVILILQSNSPNKLNEIAIRLFRTEDKDKDSEDYVSINATME